MKVRSLPSSPSASLTDSVASPRPPDPVIVPVPVPSPMLTPGGKPSAGADNVTVNVSSPSARPSSTAATVNVWDSASPVASASKVRLPLVLSKSDSDAVSPDSMLVA